jgi:hypothetical protein
MNSVTAKKTETTEVLKECTTYICPQDSRGKGDGVTIGHGTNDI